MALKIRAEKELPFKDASHITYHLNYLFRCDTAQKWTNYITKGNFAIYSDKEPKKGEVVFFNKKQEHLKEISKIIHNKINNENDFLTKGRMLRVQLIDEKKLFDKDDVSFGRKLFEAMVVADKITPICVVGHQDQEDCYLHWHLVYANDSGKDFGKMLVDGNSKVSSDLSV